MNGQTDDPDDPQAQLALDRLSSLHPILYEVIDLAIDEARACFDLEGRRFDGYTFSHLVRYHVWNLLSGEPYRSVGYYLAKLANTGLEIRYAGCVIKIWKSDDGEIPPPGSSEGRKAFYTQPQAPLFPEFFHNPLTMPAKLAVIWDVESNLAMGNLYLVCPKSFESEWMPGEAHWAIPIPHPATGIVADGSFGTPDDDSNIQLEETDESDDD